MESHGSAALYCHTCGYCSISALIKLHIDTRTSSSICWRLSKKCIRKKSKTYRTDCFWRVCPPEARSSDSSLKMRNTSTMWRCLTGWQASVAASCNVALSQSVLWKAKGDSSDVDELQGPEGREKSSSLGRTWRNESAWFSFRLRVHVGAGSVDVPGWILPLKDK